MEKQVSYHYYPKKEYSMITLNRVEKRNALSLAMADELLAHLNQAKKDRIKFLMITGSGNRMFCAGGDLNDLHSDLTSKVAEHSLLQVMEVLYELCKFPLPTIALLNGDAVGGGCELASACDIRIARQGTKFGFVQTNLGIIPGWGGGVLLAKRVHPSFAFQWITEGTIYPAEILESKGWIQKVIKEEDWHDKDKLVMPYAAKSFEQMKILKEQFLEEIVVIGLKEKMKREVVKCALLWESKEHKQAVASFLNRRF